VFDIFKKDIENTRFILTVLAVSLLALFGVAIIAIMIIIDKKPDVTVSPGLLGLLTTLLGAVIAIVSVAYTSHFKAQEDATTAREAVETANR
jgi:glucan phosphoethanolaminetransferase (alkaline phosphatase superfamily)